MTSYSGPEQVLEEGKRYALDIDTTHGPINVVLDPDLGGPIPNSIAFLATKGFYDGLSFHRVVPDFVLQGGCPNGTGTGNPGYEVIGTPPRFYEYKVGDLAMAKTGIAPPGASGSQFFVISGKSGERLPAGVRDPRPRARRGVARDHQGDRRARPRRRAAERAGAHQLHDAARALVAGAAAAERLTCRDGQRLEESVMEGGFPFGMFGDPGDMQKHLQDMAEQMQTAQKVGWADNAINLAVQMTVASINRMDLTGKPEEQAAQVRDAIRVLFPEAVMLVREAREGLT